MANASLSLPRRIVLLAAIADAYRRWRWSRLRAVCGSCVACPREMEHNAQQLLRRGHYRAAVFMARLRLEAALRALCDETAAVAGRESLARRQRRRAASMIVFLLAHERIDRATAKRIDRVYYKASNVVHGSPCPESRARQLVAKVEAVTKWLGETQATE